jgi:hypothetical protein
MARPQCSSIYNLYKIEAANTKKLKIFQRSDGVNFKPPKSRECEDSEFIGGFRLL